MRAAAGGAGDRRGQRRGEVHEDGFRAQRGRPHTLVLLPGRNARQIERLAATYDSRLLRVGGPDELLAHCREQGQGLSERTVTALLGPDGLTRERHRRRWAVAARALLVAGVLLVLGAVGVAIDPGPQHGKTLHGRSGAARVP